MINLNNETMKASNNQVDYALELQAQSKGFNLFTRTDLEEMDRDRMAIIIEHLQEQKQVVKHRNHKQPKATSEQIECMLGLTDDYDRATLKDMNKNEISRLIQYEKADYK